MKLTRLFLTAFILVLAAGCGPYPFDPAKAEQQLIQNATNHIPYVKEFHALVPTARIGVFSHNFKKGTTRIQITDVVYDRYLLTLTIHFEVNRKLEVISYAEPLITLIENISIKGDANGPLDLEHGTNFKISPDQWKKVVEAGGQFSAAGIAVKTNEPVAGIEELKTYLRRPPIQ